MRKNTLLKEPYTNPMLYCQSEVNERLNEVRYKIRFLGTQSNNDSDIPAGLGETGHQPGRWEENYS